MNGGNFCVAIVTVPASPTRSQADCPNHGHGSRPGPVSMPIEVMFGSSCSLRRLKPNARLSISEFMYSPYLYRSVVFMVSICCLAAYIFPVLLEPQAALLTVTKAFRPATWPRQWQPSQPLGPEPKWYIDQHHNRDSGSLAVNLNSRGR